MSSKDSDVEAQWDDMENMGKIWKWKESCN